ncbi:hypothetical protein B0H19DRAFT_368174 [Mycena capillaripes]|nr:hypothetical protein B0H19DRAFT_368174 [Mycena capillaripes]
MRAFSFTPSSASFVATVLGTFLYGIFFVLAISSTVLHVQRITRSLPKASGWAILGTILRSPMIMAGLVLFLTVTTRWILDFIDTAYGFQESDNAQETLMYFTTVDRPRTVAGTALVLASLIICDVMIAYRLWIVWNRSTLIVIFPTLSLLGMLGCGVGVVRQFALTAPGESPFADVRWIRSDSVLNLVTNLYSTGLISWRIYTVSSTAIHNRTDGTIDPMGIMAIVVESAAILSAWIIFEMITFARQSLLHPFVITNLGSVSGISFMLINVRAALHSSQPRSTISATSINRAHRLATAPLTRVQMETQVHTHVDVAARDNADSVYELDAVTKGRL